MSYAYVAMSSVRVSDTAMCTACGAVVGDTLAHDGWHEQILTDARIAAFNEVTAAKEICEEHLSP